MTLTEATACIEVHNTGKLGQIQSVKRATKGREEKQSALLSSACDLLHVRPAFLVNVEISRVMEALKKLTRTPVKENVVRKAVEEFSANAALSEPETQLR